MSEERRSRGRPRKNLVYPADTSDPVLTPQQKSGILRHMYDMRSKLCSALDQADHVLDFLERRQRLPAKDEVEIVDDLD